MKKIGTLLACLMALLALCACAQADESYGKAVIDAGSSARLHLRAEPSSKSDSYGLYFTGTEVECLSDPEAEWVEVKIVRERGYMKSTYLKRGAAGDRVTPRWQQGTVDAINWINMRMGPSTEYQFVCRVKDGAPVTIMGETDEHWYYVQANGETGFVSANLVSLGGGSGGSGHSNGAGSANDSAGAAQDAWRKAYAAWLDKNGSPAYTYDLIAVNGDGVPELAIHTGAEAGGCQILTYGKSGVDVLQTKRLGFTYMPWANRLSNSAGHMDHYYDNVSEIRDGQWKCVAQGSDEGYKDGWSDEQGRYICQTYAWNGRQVSMEQYLSAYAKVYDASRAVQARWSYSLDQIRAILGN